MEGNELNVFVHTPPEERARDENSASESLSKHTKGGFRNFVEESTMRNVSLDELEELSDAGCSSRIDGTLRRTSSSISSEPPVRQAFVLQWNTHYLNRPEGLLRVGFLACSIMSLACLSSAGNIEVDVLEMPFSLDVRAHIFISVLAILIGGIFFFIGISSLADSFPSLWNVGDAAIHSSLCCLFAFSSAMLLHSETHHALRHHEPPISEWTKMLVTSSAVFGFLSTFIGVIIVFLRGCANRSLVASEDIMLTSLRTS